METLILLFDTIVVMVLVFYSLKNEKLPEGTSEVGPFRIKRPDKAPEPKVVAPLRGRRL